MNTPIAQLPIHEAGKFDLFLLKHLSPNLIMLVLVLKGVGEGEVDRDAKHKELSRQFVSYIHESLWTVQELVDAVCAVGNLSLGNHIAVEIGGILKSPIKHLQTRYKEPKLNFS